MPIRRTSRSRSSAPEHTAGAEEPTLLLVTGDPALRDDIGLLAAVAGARVHMTADWGQIAPHGWAAVLCGPDAPPPEHWRGEVLLVVPETPDVGEAVSGEPIAGEATWALAARHPQLRPVPLPAGEQWLAEHLTACVLNRLPGRVLVVLGALGGVGTSTVAYLAAAEAAARGQRVLLLDADPGAGSGLRTLRDHARRTGTLERGETALDWAELAHRDGSLSAAQLTGALAEVDGISLITGEPAEDDAVPAALAAVVTAARRATDLVVVDAGRRPSVLDLLGGPPDAGLLVTEPSSRGAAAVADLPLRGHDVGWSLVLMGRSRRGVTSGEAARRLGVPLAAELAEQRWMRRVDVLSETYELLRSRRGADFAGSLIAAAGAEGQAGGERRAVHEAVR